MIEYNDKILKTLLYRDVENLFNFSNIFSDMRDTGDFTIDMATLKRHFKSHYQRMYEEEEIDNIYQYYYRNTLDEVVDGDYVSALDLIYFLTKDFITDDGKIKSELFMDWYGMYSKASEDILYSIYLAYIKAPFNAEFIYNVPTDDERIEEKLKKIKSENHMHLKASAVVYPFNFYNVIIKNNSLGHFHKEISTFIKSRSFENNSTELFYDNAFYKMKVLKIFFSNLISPHSDPSINFNDMMNDLEEILSHKDNHIFTIKKRVLNKFFSHQIPPTFDEKKPFTSCADLINFINIEREFIYDIVKYSIQHDNVKYKDLVYLYIYYNNQIIELFQMSNKMSNFNEFLTVQDSKNTLFKNNKHLGRRYLEAVIFTYDFDNVKNVEYRTAPSTPGDHNSESIILYRAALESANKINLINVSHFIKSKNVNIRDLKRDIKLIRRTSKHSRYISVVGIDAANKELVCFPEKYGWVFRTFNNLKYFKKVGQHDNDLPFVEKRSNDGLEQFNKTFHVAEVYISILNGLRRIYDTVTYLNLASGDRLGHTVALGTSVEKYYKKRTNIFQKLDHYISDLVWLYYFLIDNNYSCNSIISHLSERIDIEIDKLNSYLIRDGIKINKLNFYNYLVLKSDMLSSDRDTYDTTYQTLLKIININPELKCRYNVNDPRYKQAFEDKVAVELAWYLSGELQSMHPHRDSTKKYLEKQVQVNYDENYVNAISFVQKKLVELVDNKGISIESNLSSNYLITEIDRFDEHPIFNLNSKRLDGGHNDLTVTLNTDDAGIFRTTLNQEYRILVSTLKNSKSHDLSNNEILEYVEYLIKKSNEVHWNHEKEL